MHARQLVLRLLFDCDDYLATHRALLDQAAAGGLSAAGVKDMELATEHLARSVATTWRAVCMDMADQVDEEVSRADKPPADPGLNE